MLDTAVQYLTILAAHIVEHPSGIALIILAIALPALHAAQGKRKNWTAPRRVLTAYVGLIFLGLLALTVSGIILQSAAPDTFSVLRKDLNSSDGGPAAIFLQIVFDLPAAFAVSSLIYGAVYGWRWLPYGVLGIIAAVGLYALEMIAALFIACYAWATCI